MIKLLDFYADWCGPCKIMGSVIEEVETDYEGKIEFQKVDVESDSEMALKFGIMHIPTLVLVKEDKEIERKTGAMTKDMLKVWLDSYTK